LALTFYFVSSYAKSPIWLIPAQVAIGLSFVRFPAQLSLGAESVEPGRRTLAFSTLGFFSVLPGTFMSLLAGFMAVKYGYSIVFLIAILLEVGSLGFSLFVKETLVDLEEQTTQSSMVPSFRRILVPPKNLRGFFLVNAMDSFAWGIGAGILYGMISQRFHFDPFQIAVIEWVLVTVFTIAQLPAGKLMQRSSRKVFMIFSEAIGIPLMIGWLVSNTVSDFVALSVLFGVSAPMWVPAVNTILANSVPKRVRGAASGQLAAFRGFFSFPAPLVGGILFDQYGYNAPIIAGLIFVTLTTLMVFFFVHEPPHTQISL
jgi:MFS family permease